MAYTPKTWVPDEEIPSADLNRMERGIQEALQAGGGSSQIARFSFEISEDEQENLVVSSAPTWAAVTAAIAAGKFLLADILLPGELPIVAPLSTYYPETAPTSVRFSVALDIANPGAPPARFLVQIIMTEHLNSASMTELIVGAAAEGE